MTSPTTEPMPRAERARAARRRNRRRIAIAAGVVVLAGAVVGGALLLRDDDGDGDGEGAAREVAATTRATAAATTTPPTTAPPPTPLDPTACLRGTFRFAAMEYKAPAPTVYGPVEISGGLAGRRIEIRTDNTFTFTDDGSEPVNIRLVNGDIPGTAVLAATAGGTIVPTAASPTEGSVQADVMTLSGSLVVTLEDGQVIDVPLPPDAAGVEETFGLIGGAAYTCDDTRVNAEFQNVRLELERV